MRMHILNEQTITIATALLLCFAGSHVCLAKPPAKSAAGAANHMQRGIELAQQKNFPAAITNLPRQLKRTRKMHVVTLIAAQPIDKRHRQLRQPETQVRRLQGIRLLWLIFQRRSKSLQRMKWPIASAG